MNQYSLSALILILLIVASAAFILNKRRKQNRPEAVNEIERDFLQENWPWIDDKNLCAFIREQESLILAEAMIALPMPDLNIVCERKYLKKAWEHISIAYECIVNMHRVWKNQSCKPYQHPSVSERLTPAQLCLSLQDLHQKILREIRCTSNFSAVIDPEERRQCLQITCVCACTALLSLRDARKLLQFSYFERAEEAKK